MFVTKRDGSREKVSFDQITTRINSLCEGLDTRFVDPGELAQKVISGLVSGVTTSQLDHQTADTAAAMTTKHPDYATLAARLVVSDLHKRTKPTFTAAMEMLYEHRDPKRGTHAPLISWNLLCLARDYEDQINERLDPLRDFTFSYFGFKVRGSAPYQPRRDKKTLFLDTGEVLPHPGRRQGGRASRVHAHESGPGRPRQGPGEGLQDV